jgi:hypothetical protein
VAYEKRAAAIKPDLEAYNAAKAAQPSRALELDPMEYGKEQEVCEDFMIVLHSTIGVSPLAVPGSSAVFRVLC